jgi:hypothetical protein
MEPCTQDDGSGVQERGARGPESENQAMVTSLDR